MFRLWSGPAIITVHLTVTGSFGIITRHHNIFVAFVHFEMQVMFVLLQKLEV
jgi:hypothetical protein